MEICNTKIEIMKTRFTQEEDDKLKELVSIHSNDWSVISKQIKGRTPKQCKARWEHYLSPAIPYTEKSIDEINKIRLSCVEETYNHQIDIPQQQSTESKIDAGEIQKHINQLKEYYSTEYDINCFINDISIVILDDTIEKMIDVDIDLTENDLSPILVLQ